MESLATYRSHVLIVGNLNLHLECTTHSNRTKFIKLLDTFNLHQIVQEPTHDRGGLLDVVVASGEYDLQGVVVVDTGLPDHKLVC